MQAYKPSGPLSCTCTRVHARVHVHGKGVPPLLSSSLPPLPPPLSPPFLAACCCLPWGSLQDGLDDCMGHQLLLGFRLVSFPREAQPPVADACQHKPACFFLLCSCCYSICSAFAELSSATRRLCAFAAQCFAAASSLAVQLLARNSQRR